MFVDCCLLFVVVGRLVFVICHCLCVFLVALCLLLDVRGLLRVVLCVLLGAWRLLIVVFCLFVDRGLSCVVLVSFARFPCVVVR